MADKGKLLKKYGQLKNERASYISHWREIAEVIDPKISRFLINSAATARSGVRVDQHILNNTPMVAARTLRYSMFAGAASPAVPWFAMSTSNPALNENAAVKAYLFECENRIREVFLKSNIYNVLPDIFGSAADFGTAALLILEDEKTVIRCHSLPIGSYCLATDANGRTNTLYREFAFTVDQLVTEFGIENVSVAAKNLYESGSTGVWINCVQVIEPNTEQDATALAAKYKPFRSAYFEQALTSTAGLSSAPVTTSDNKFLRESGFDEQSFAAPRWETIDPLDVYGSRQPGAMALGDVKMLQLLERRKIQAIDKLINPPMAVDASLKNQQTSLLPGGITYVNGMTNSAGRGFAPVYEINPHLKELSDVIETTEDRINRAYYKDVMSLFSGYEGPQMTAAEVQAKTQDKLVALGPVLMQLNEELFDPLIERTYNIMHRKGLLPQAPPELANQSLNIEYISVIAQAQKLVKTAGIERLAGFIGNLAGAIPEVLDKFNSDNAVDSYADMLGVPPNVVNSNDQVQALRQAKAKAQAQQQAMANMPNVKAGADAASTIASTVAANPQLAGGGGGGPAGAGVLAQAGQANGSSEPTALQRLLGQ